jgi:hypothetical protein
VAAFYAKVIDALGKMKRGISFNARDSAGDRADPG